MLYTFGKLKIRNKEMKYGPDRGSNPEPLAPKARIIPLDHQALLNCQLFFKFKYKLLLL